MEKNGRREMARWRGKARPQTRIFPNRFRDGRVQPVSTASARDDEKLFGILKSRRHVFYAVCRPRTHTWKIRPLT